MIHVYTTQGNRPYQEDVYVYKLKYSCFDATATETEIFGRIPIDILGVFDGHGGGAISDAVARMLPAYFYKSAVLEDNEPKPTTKYNDYIVSVFDKVQNELNVRLINNIASTMQFE